MSGWPMEIESVSSSPLAKAFKIIPLVIIIVISLGGNLLLVYAVYSDVRMRTSTNFFIVSQCMADLGTTMLVIPFALFAVINEGWILDEISCIANGFFNMYFTIVTLLNLAVIAFDRFFAIVKTSHHTIKKTEANFIIFLVWGLSMLGAVPWLTLFSKRVDTVFLPGFYICGQEYVHPVRTAELATLIAQTVCFAFLPFLAIVYSFYHIIKVVRGNRHRVFPAALSNAQKIATQVYAKSAYTSMMVIVTSLMQVFPACFTMTFEGLLVVHIPYALETSLKWIMWCHCCIKPLIYFRKNRKWSRKFRDYLRKVLLRFFIWDSAMRTDVERVFSKRNNTVQSKNGQSHSRTEIASAGGLTRNESLVSRKYAWSKTEIAFHDIS